MERTTSGSGKAIKQWPGVKHKITSDMKTVKRNECKENKRDTWKV